MPLLPEDAIPATAGENPARALTRREVTNAQKQNAELMTPPKPAQPAGGQREDAGRPPDSPSGLSGAEQAQQNQPAQQPEPKQPKIQPGRGTGLPGAATSMTPEQMEYAKKVAANPWLPIADTGQMTAESLWHVAHHVGAAWNALIDPNAMSAAQQSIWSRNDAVGKLMQIAEGGLAGQLYHDQSEWFFENVFPMFEAAPAYFNPISGTALLALGLAGEGPANLQNVPGAVSNALPIAELGTVAKNPEALKTDPELASRLFWKAANAALIGVSVLPFGKLLRGLKIMKPEQIQELSQTAERLKQLQPGDPNAQPDGALLQKALNLPPLPDESLVARGVTRDVRQMERSPTGEYSDLTAKQRGRINKALGITGFEDLPHMAPNWTAAQAKLARKVLPGWLPYDLVRKSSKDIVPQDPYLFMDQLGEKEGPAAMRYLAAFNHSHLQVLRGPLLDPLNAAESMVHSLPSVHTGTRYVMTKFFAAEEELMKTAGLDDKALMKAIRDPDAYNALTPAGKVVVNAQKILRRVYADQARAFGHREGFVPNYDPRVKLQEELPIEGTQRGMRGAAKSLSGESKASREEQFSVNPDDPAQIALTEKYPDVFSLNKAMGQMRQEHITNATKSNRQRILEDKLLHGRDDPNGALRAITTLNEMEGKWPSPDPKLLAQATEAATRRYPLFHEGLHAASLRSLERQISALHSHIGLQQALNALAHDGKPLAFERTAREIPAGYKKLDNAAPAFDNYVFHPDLANPLNRISQRVEASALDSWVKLNQLSVAALMFSPMIHGDNMIGRMAWLLGKHPIAGASEGASSIAHSKPWAMLEQVMGVKHASEAERIKWQMGMELEAINAGVIPHFPSQGMSNLLYSEYGKAIGDVTAFERPGTRETWRLPPAFQAIPNAARSVGRGYDALQNLLWGRMVMPLGIFSFHVEKAAFKAANPGLPDLVAAQYAAHLANRWQGAIEPMARSQAMNTLWKTAGFAINWVRSFYELALPSYLSKSAVAAHPELKGYILRQEMQSLMGMLAAQHISGNLMNMILSGHPQWENDPANRYYLEITRPEVIRGLQAMGLYRNVDAATGRVRETGGKLVVENPVARQQLQLERMLGLEPGTPPMQGAQDMLAGHLAPLVDTLAAAFNLNLPQTILSGTPRWVDQGNPKPEPPWQANLPAVLAQFLGVSSTIGRQVQLDASGRPQQNDTMPAWLQGAPVPDAVKRYAAPAAQQTWNWLTGVRAPYVRAERTEGLPVTDQNYAQYQQLSTAYQDDMTNWSDQVMQGKITPYEWRTKYAARAHDYAIRLDQIFNGAPEYKQGSLGLYAGYQKLYDDAQLPDGTGVDWGKLDGLQADYTEKLTAAQQADLQSEIAKHDNAYPALGMYRATIDAHTSMAKAFAQSQGISYGNLMAELQAARSLDDRGFQQYTAQHQELSAYFRAQTEWEINTWPGRLYSLYYHTSALSKWLVPAEGEAGPAAEEKALSEIEQHYRAPAAAASGG